MTIREHSYIYNIYTIRYGVRFTVFKIPAKNVLQTRIYIYARKRNVNCPKRMGY